MTMKRIASFLLFATLTACGPSEQPKQPAYVPTVGQLAVNPEELRR